MNKVELECEEMKKQLQDKIKQLFETQEAKDNLDNIIEEKDN